MEIKCVSHDIWSSAGLSTVSWGASFHAQDSGAKCEQKVGGGGDLFRCQGRWSGWALVLEIGRVGPTP